MLAIGQINPKRPSETLIDVFQDESSESLIAWGGVNLQTNRPFIVYTPNNSGRRRFSVKQEGLFRAFLLAGHISFVTTGHALYRPNKVYDCYDLVRGYVPIEQLKEMFIEN